MVLAALLLIWPAFYNGFPLVFADSGTYLGQALMFYVGWDRPPFYSLFLHLSHWRLSLWLPIFVQGLLTAHLLHLALRVQGMGGPLPLLLAAVMLATVTGLPFVTAQLQPDMFTGLVILCAWLLGFRRDALTRLEAIYVFLLASLGIMVHQSHLPLALGLALVGALLTALACGLREALRRFTRMAAPVLLAVLGLLSVHLVVERTVSLSPHGAVFYATRLLFDGTALDYLDRHCPEIGFRICDIRGELGDDHNEFLWMPTSPLYIHLGGPKAWTPEAKALVRGVLIEDPFGVFRKAVENTLIQLAHIDSSDGLGAWRGAPGPEAMIERYFPRDYPAYVASQQQIGMLFPLVRRLGPLHAVAFCAGLSGLLAALAWRRLTLPELALAAMLLAGLLGNAVITGALSGPADRYQARLIWIAPFAAMVLLAPRLRTAAAEAALSPGRGL
ncbi:hypothetical protein JMJ55_07775 [Belnapia sp. T6]|uniref:Glycosyltransferase RgtA/B/C/D-like domain-containing protein n=1 Tax=Belnapia mucosa TaxID=2804532 RepID=A0ABS1V0W8_9PROT|nr:hypothetical protein [Belnapia mucosa]MBL6455217.1 hypothetical protein [Belnapia mucosa]